MFEKIQKLLAKQLDIDPALITPETHIIDDLGADSLDIAELIMNLEEEFGVIIADDSANELFTVGQITEFVEKLV